MLHTSNHRLPWCEMLCDLEVVLAITKHDMSLWIHLQLDWVLLIGVDYLVEVRVITVTCLNETHEFNSYLPLQSELRNLILFLLHLIFLSITDIVTTSTTLGFFLISKSLCPNEMWQHKLMHMCPRFWISHDCLTDKENPILLANGFVFDFISIMGLH